MFLGQSFEIPSGVTSKRFSGETVILDLERGLYFGLDVVGSKVWGLIEESKPLNAILSELIQEYEVVPSKLYTDVVALISDLESHGLLRLI